ncbi:MAG: hypothetical protein ABIQ18_14280 [Umezawaea sp.]
MAALSEITKAALHPRLMRRAQTRWPQLAEITVRFHGRQAYIGAVLTNEDEPLKLCRLTWQGSPENWRFAIYEHSGDRYADCMLPGGGLTGTPEAALDCACGLYLNDLAAYSEPPTD